MRFINSEDHCSGGLRKILQDKGIPDGPFELPIEESPIFNTVRGLNPKLPNILHIGCSTDCREPSIEIRERRGRLRSKKGLYSFRYERIIPPAIVHSNAWFHDDSGQRNLDKLAQALNNWRHCEETILFSIDTSESTLGRTAAVVLYFGNNRLREISDIEQLLVEPFTRKLIGFDGSVIKQLAMAVQDTENEGRPYTEQDWLNLFQENNLTIETVIKELYALYQRSSRNLPNLKYVPRF